MAITGLEDISLRKKEVKESRNGSIQTTKTLIFKHEASFGDLVIDTTALVAPADALGNGFIQDNVSSLNLLVNKKNLKIHSSRGVWLQMHEDFLVSSAHTIQLIGNIAELGGAEDGEVFTIYATPVQANATITTDHKRMWQEYTLLDGEDEINFGREYEYGRNLAVSQIGAIRVYRSGVGPLLRNVANAAADPGADGNFQEIGTPLGGTGIKFNVPANGQDELIIIEFGLEYAGDLSTIGDLQSLYGIMMKLAEDVKELGPYPVTRYLTASPSEVERRNFGDSVQTLLNARANIVTLTGAGDYTPSAGTRWIRVRGVAGGGGGGGAANIASCAGGGGGGGQYFEIVLPVATYAYSVGIAGAAGNTAGSNGGTGGSTIFGPVTANGGLGGVGGTSPIRPGGVGGSGVTGADFEAQGGTGGNSIRDGAQGLGGLGGASMFGSGGYGGENTFIAPSNGLAPGSGGGGGGANGGAQAGALGAPGTIIVEEYQ